MCCETSCIFAGCLLKLLIPSIQWNSMSATLPICTIKFDVISLLKQPVVPQTVTEIRVSITLTDSVLFATLETRFERSGSFPGPCSRRMLQGNTACNILSGPHYVTVTSVPPTTPQPQLLGATHSRLWFRLPVVHTGSPHLIPIIHLTRNIPISSVAVLNPKTFNDSTDLFMTDYCNLPISCVLQQLFTVYINPWNGYYVYHLLLTLKSWAFCP